MTVPVTTASTLEATEEPSSTHRLPTVSAVDALLELQNGNSDNVITGLDAIDRFISEDRSGPRSLQPGKITEIWGPPGSGKTGLMLQIARNTLLAGKSVLWMDAMAPINGPRLQHLFEMPDVDSDLPLQRFHHIKIRNLAQLLALILHPRPDFPPRDTSLIVIDGLHSLLDTGYPRFVTDNGLKGEALKWQTGRRYSLLGTIANGLNQFSALKGVVSLVSTGSASRMRSENGLGAAMVPGVGGPEWEAGIWNRLCLFRDFQCRYIGIQKSQGKGLLLRLEPGEFGRPVPIEIISDGGVREISGYAMPQPTSVRPETIKPRKRMFDEIADSEGEGEGDEYDWVEADDLFLGEGTKKDSSGL